MVDCKVNRKFFPIKGSFFSVLAGVACLLPYLSVYMKQLGLSSTESGLIYGVMPFLGFLVRPITGSIADKFNKHKLLLIICCVTSGIFHAALLAVPAKPKSSPSQGNGTVSLVCESEKAFIEYCPKSIACDGRIDGKGFDLSDCSLNCDISSNMTICVGNECDKTSSSKDSNVTSHDGYDIWSEGSKCVHVDVNTSVAGGEHLSLHCSTPSRNLCQLHCPGKHPLSYIMEDCPELPEEKGFSMTFVMFFSIYLLANVPFAPIIDLITAMSYDMLGDQHHRWGKERLWGTVGFGLFGLTSGFLMDALSSNPLQIDYTYAFIGFLVLSIVTGVFAGFYQISESFSTKNMLKNVAGLLKNLDILGILFTVFLFGMFTGVIEVFLYWHLQTLGASQLLLGFALAMNCVPEIPILFLSGRVIAKIGQIKCLYIAYLAYCVRFLGYSFLQNPWYTLLIEPIHGITFGLMYSAATSFACVKTPPGMHGTVQGLIGGTHFGFGKGIGSVLGGVAFGAFGAVRMFQGCSAIALIGLVLYLIFNLIHSRRGRGGEEAMGEQEEGLKPLSDENQPKNNKIYKPQRNGSKEKVQSSDCIEEKTQFDPNKEHDIDNVDV